MPTFTEPIPTPGKAPKCICAECGGVYAQRKTKDGPRPRLHFPRDQIRKFKPWPYGLEYAADYPKCGGAYKEPLPYTPPEKTL